MGWMATARDRLLGRTAPTAVRAAGAGAFWEGATQGRRWQMAAPSSGPNTAILASGKVLADRILALDRNEPFVKRGLDALTVGIVGTGIEPRSEVDDPELQEQTHKLWGRFMTEIDADGVTDGYGMQALSVRDSVTGGDSLWRKRPRRVDDRARYMPTPLAVPLQFQLLEGEMLRRDRNERLPNGGKIIGGVEYSPFGSVVAYHLWRDHPSERLLFGVNSGETVRVAADDILHVREIRRVGQVRGTPRCASVMLPAHDFHQGEDALQKSWNLQAVLSAFIEIGDYEVASQSGWLPILTPEEQAAARAANTGTAPTTLEPGDMPLLRPGQTIKQMAPPSVGDTYDVAQKLRLRRMCAALGVPYEQLAMDLERVSYSSARIGLINFWQDCDVYLWHVLVPQALWPLWVTFYDTAVRAGALPVSLADYLADPWKFLTVSWIPPKRPWVDPLKDVQGEVMAINNGLISRDESILSRGGVPERVDAARRRSMEREKALDLPPAPGIAPAGERATPPATDDADTPDGDRRAA